MKKKYVSPETEVQFVDESQPLLVGTLTVSNTETNNFDHLLSRDFMIDDE